jgi:hypothetical protein
MQEPATSLLKSNLAGMYWQLFRNLRYNLYNRTSTVDFKKEDPNTWSADDFHHKIGTLYMESVRQENLLQQTRLDAYEALIIRGNARNLRPTLFDLLAHEALAYFQDDESMIKKPAYAFEISQPTAFAPAAQFASIRFETRDSLSLKHKALQLFQRLIAFHLKDNNPDALIDVDLDRLQFVQVHSTLEDKDERYKKALENLIRQFPTRSDQATYLLARWYIEGSYSYDPLKDTSRRYDLVTARKLLESVVRDSSHKTEGWVNSFNHLQILLHSAYSFQLEKVNLPNEPFRVLVTYKNVPQLFFRVLRLDKALEESLESGNNTYWSSVTKARPVKSWTQPLPATGDLQQHRVEVPAEGLPVGSYILLSSLDNNFSLKTSILGAQRFQVTNISYVYQGTAYFILHRKTGQPLAQAKLTSFTMEYDSKQSRYIRKTLGDLCSR